jgi:hypothetical protein
MKRLCSFLLFLTLAMTMLLPAAAVQTDFGEPEEVALAVGGNGIKNGTGFLGSFVCLTRDDVESIYAVCSGEATYRLGLGDCFSELTSYSSFENHGEPVWSYRRAYGIDLRLLAEALGIDTGKAVSIFVSAPDGMSKTLGDAFSANTKRYAFDTKGAKQGEVGPMLVMFETSNETSELGKGEYPALPRLGAESPDRAKMVFAFGQTANDEITSCFWVKDVNRLRIGTEKAVILMTSAAGKQSTAPMSAIAALGRWSASFGSVSAQGLPLSVLLEAYGITVSSGESVKAVSCNGDELYISAGELSGAFAAWDATDGGSKVTNATALRIYTTGGKVLADLSEISIVKAAEQPAGGFTDMDAYPWAKRAVEELSSRGIISGRGDGSFAPGESISRGDFVLMLDRALGFAETSGTGFGDVPESAYYAAAVTRAKALGIAQGADNKFRPGDRLTRQEAMVLIDRALTASGRGISAHGSLDGYSDAASVAAWARDAAARLTAAGVMSGADGKLDPGGYMTRAQLAVALYRALGL